MFKKQIFTMLLVLFSIIFIPTVALAQTTDTFVPRDSFADIDWDNYYDDLTGYPDEEVSERLATVLVGLLTAYSVVILPAFLILYIYTSFAYMEIAKKLNHPNPWYAWFPILRDIQKFQLADMSPWFILLYLIPIANTVISIIALMKICEKRGMDKFLGFLGLIPIGNLILIGILAWKKE